MYSFIYFEHPISHRIPLDGVEFTIPSSGIAKEQHEVSMADLENILNQSSEYDPDYQFPNITIETQEDMAKVIGGRIRRGGKLNYQWGLIEFFPNRFVDIEFVAQHHHSLYQDTPRAVMQNFLRWGGFHELKPLEKRRTIQGNELFPGKDDLDNIRMRAALQQTAMILDQPNPNYERPKPLAIKTKKDEASTSRPSLGALAFGGLQEEAAPKRRGAASPNLAEKLQTSANTEVEASTTSKSSPLSSPPLTTTTTTAKSRDSEPLQTPPSRVLPTAEQLAAKEALKKQLDFAKQLKQTLATPYTGRKQAKPSLKQPKRKPQEAVGKELDFDHPDYIPKSLPEPEAEKPGVLKRLWGGIFGDSR